MGEIKCDFEKLVPSLRIYRGKDSNDKARYLEQEVDLPSSTYDQIKVRRRPLQVGFVLLPALPRSSDVPCPPPPLPRCDLPPLVAVTAQPLCACVLVVSR